MVKFGGEIGTLYQIFTPCTPLPKYKRAFTLFWGGPISCQDAEGFFTGGFPKTENIASSRLSSAVSGSSCVHFKCACDERDKKVDNQSVFSSPKHMSKHLISAIVQ